MLEAARLKWSVAGVTVYTGICWRAPQTAKSTACHLTSDSSRVPHKRLVQDTGYLVIWCRWTYMCRLYIWRCTTPWAIKNVPVLFLR